MPFEQEGQHKPQHEALPQGRIELPRIFREAQQVLQAFLQIDPISLKAIVNDEIISHCAQDGFRLTQLLGIYYDYFLTVLQEYRGGKRNGKIFPSRKKVNIFIEKIENCKSLDEIKLLFATNQLNIDNTLFMVVRFASIVNAAKRFKDNNISSEAFQLSSFLALVIYQFEQITNFNVETVSNILSNNKPAPWRALEKIGTLIIRHNELIPKSKLLPFNEIVTYSLITICQSIETIALNSDRYQISINMAFTIAQETKRQKNLDIFRQLPSMNKQNIDSLSRATPELYRLLVLYYYTIIPVLQTFSFTIKQFLPQELSHEIVARFIKEHESLAELILFPHSFRIYLSRIIRPAFNIYETLSPSEWNIILSELENFAYILPEKLASLISSVLKLKVIPVFGDNRFKSPISALRKFMDVSNFRRVITPEILKLTNPLNDTFKTPRFHESLLADLITIGFRLETTIKDYMLPSELLAKKHFITINQTNYTLIIVINDPHLSNDYHRFHQLTAYLLPINQESEKRYPIPLEIRLHLTSYSEQVHRTHYQIKNMHLIAILEILAATLFARSLLEPTWTRQVVGNHEFAVPTKLVPYLDFLYVSEGYENFNEYVLKFGLVYRNLLRGEQLKFRGQLNPKYNNILIAKNLLKIANISSVSTRKAIVTFIRRNTGYQASLIAYCLACRIIEEKDIPKLENLLDKITDIDEICKTIMNLVFSLLINKELNIDNMFNQIADANGLRRALDSLK